MTVLRVLVTSVLTLALMVIMMESSTSSRSVADVSTGLFQKIVEKSTEDRRLKRQANTSCTDYLRRGSMKPPYCKGYITWFK
ncbi:hypothetical protein BsWGS_09569 [Bradybaena similaris]